MKSLRLNKQLRAKIVQNFSDKREQSNPCPKVTTTRQSVENSMAVKIQKKLYSKYEGVIPDEFVYTTSAVKVQLPAGNIEYFYFGKLQGKNIHLLTTKESKVEYVFTKDDPLYIEWRQSIDEYKQQSALVDEWKKDHKHYVGQVSQIVDAVNTTNQLIEVWPEAEQFIPEDIRDPSTINLPSVNVAELNKQI